MNWNTWIRQTHRWVSIVFTALLLSGLYLFVLPYATRWRSARGAGARGTALE